MVPVTVACAVFMTSLDQNVVVTALPGIGESLGRAPSQLGLLVTVYVASLIISMPVGGWAAERFGLRNSYCVAVFVFGLASVLCGISSDLWSLVGARALQGFGGALMGTLGQVTVLQSFPRSRTLKINMYISLAGQLAPLVGPLVPVVGPVVPGPTFVSLLLGPPQPAKARIRPRAGKSERRAGPRSTRMGSPS